MADLTDLQAAQSIKIVGATGSGTESNFVAVTPANEIRTSTSHNTTYVSNVLSVGTTQVLAASGGSNLSNRREILIFNDGNKDIYFGPSGVSATGSTKGIKIGVGAFQSIPAGESVFVYLVVQTGTTSVIVQEFS